MLDKNYMCLNSKTFEVIELENCLVLDRKIGEIISILNKKGYYTKMCSEASVFKPFLIADLINNLLESKLLKIKGETIETLKEIIKKDDYESTIIIFKENYFFKNLPKGFKIINNSLIYYLSVLKNCSQLDFKSLVELDKEKEASFINLKKWAKELPPRN